MRLLLNLIGITILSFALWIFIPHVYNIKLYSEGKLIIHKDLNKIFTVLSIGQLIGYYIVYFAREEMSSYKEFAATVGCFIIGLTINILVAWGIIYLIANVSPVFMILGIFYLIIAGVLGIGALIDSDDYYSVLGITYLLHNNLYEYSSYWWKIESTKNKIKLLYNDNRPTNPQGVQNFLG